MAKPTKPTVPDPALRSQPDTFRDRIEDNLLFWSTLATYMSDAVDFTDEKATEALAAAIGGDLPPLTGKALNLLRVNSGESAAELATLVDILKDANGNEQLDFSAVAAAVNFLRIVNAATGDGPEFQAQGDDANIDLVIRPKGTGKAQIVKPDFAFGSDANGDIVIRSGGKYIRLPKGADGKVLKLVSGVPAWADVGGLPDPDYTAGPITLAAGATVYSHGLSRVKHMRVWIQCVTTEFAYEVGDRIYIGPGGGRSSAYNAIVSDSGAGTDIRVAVVASGYQIYTEGSNATAVIDDASPNWEQYIEVWGDA